MLGIVWVTGETVTLWVIFWYAIFFWFAIVCFRKRHILWLILGFFLPFLWLIGAILPDRRRREEVVVVEERR
jgi:hypothetical protein